MENSCGPKGPSVVSRSVTGPIRVDIEGLDLLAHDLRTIQHQFNDLGRDFHRFDAAIGANRVRERLAEVAVNWSQARERVNEEVSRLADMAASAAETYRATERDISGATDSPRQAG